MLHEFLIKNEPEILALTAKKTLDLAGARVISAKLEQGLPIFFGQLMEVLRLQGTAAREAIPNKAAVSVAADASDEPAMAKAAGRPDEAKVAETAGVHGAELQRLGYTLSHVVHAYGSICQAITEVAAANREPITANEFHDLNRCLDVAIAGAVTEYQSLRNKEDKTREVEHLGFLAHELRNALSSVNIALRLIKTGTVGFGGSTGRVLDRGIKRMAELIDRSLTEVRLRVDPTIHPESAPLLQLVDQIVLTMEVEAQAKNQTLAVRIDPELVIEADQQLYYSVLSNLVQNAVKFTHAGGRIEIRASIVDGSVVVEVQDECGGLATNVAAELFKPFEQQNTDRSGLGLGLTIAERAIKLNGGTIAVQNLPGRGCIFRVSLPRNNR